MLPELLLLFWFSGPHQRHVEVPRLGVKSELQMPAYTQPQQRQIQALSATYTTTHDHAGSLTHGGQGLNPRSHGY